MKSKIGFYVLTSVLTFIGMIGTVVAEETILKADYRFANSLENILDSGHPLINLGTNSFNTDIVDGVSTTVLNFEAGSGVALESAASLIDSDNYSIAVLFRFEQTGSWRRIIDFLNRTSDTGLYAYGANLQFYNVSTGSGGSILPGSYIQVVITRDSSKNVVGYVNGNPEINFVDNAKTAVINSSDILAFFRDDLIVANEHSAGSVARIRLYNGVLSPQQVGSLDRLPGVNVDHPIITSDLHVSGTVGNPFSYQITALNNPIYFSATNLPEWAVLDNSTGLITGTPNEVGITVFPISAVNAGGSGTASLTISIISSGNTQISFSIPNQSVFENSDTANIYIIRSGQTDTEDEVSFSTQEASAISDTDFVPKNGTVSFLPGETFKIIPIKILDDTLIESTETFTLLLSNSTGSAVLSAPDKTTVSILDNDEYNCPSIFDIGGDRKIGLEEAINALQIVSGIRSEN